jgi:NAD(P)-dependent dehydrogenase (short-subunit alcohol dehydrogenase family)
LGDESQELEHSRELNQSGFDRPRYFQEARRSAEVTEQALPTPLQAMPMGRVGRVEEAATVVLFLASEIALL